MTAEEQDILRCLRLVAAERQRRTVDVSLAARVQAVKAYQHGRFERMYADLLNDRRYRAATTFFLNDVYGTADFSQRDDQFARIVPALIRLFPRQIIGTVLELATLHAISERLDTAMAQALVHAVITGNAYGLAWRAVGQRQRREQQIALMLSVGRSLDRHTRNPLLRHSLRLMRGPAQAAGLQTLQHFLETGFDSFRQMRGADKLLDAVSQRERKLTKELFAGAGQDDVQAADQKTGAQMRKGPIN